MKPGADFRRDVPPILRGIANELRTASRTGRFPGKIKIGDFRHGPCEALEYLRSDAIHDFAVEERVMYACFYWPIVAIQQQYEYTNNRVFIVLADWLDTVRMAVQLGRTDLDKRGKQGDRRCW